MLGLIRGVEALLRWLHPTRGMVSPGVFIPVAERFGRITGLGDGVIDEACRHMGQWARSGVAMRVAINLSACQLREPHVVQRIESALKRHDVPALRLRCEITESAAKGDFRATQASLEGLAHIGV